MVVCRKALLVATSIVAVGGTAAAAYVHSQNSRRRHNSFGHSNGGKDIKEEEDQLIGNDKNVKTSRQKRGNLRSLQVLVAILLSRMGRMGAIDILSLLAIAVKFSTQEGLTFICSHFLFVSMPCVHKLNFILQKCITL